MGKLNNCRPSYCSNCALCPVHQSSQSCFQGKASSFTTLYREHASSENVPYHRDSVLPMYNAVDNLAENICFPWSEIFSGGVYVRNSDRIRVSSPTSKQLLESIHICKNAPGYKRIHEEKLPES